MTTDAETIASLRAELAELGVRIGAPDSVADLRSAAHRTWRIASLLQREHKELRAALLAMEHRATTAEATVAALMAGAAEEFAVLRDAAVADAAAVCERMAQGHDRIAAASSPAAEERHKGVAAALRLAADRIRALAPQPPPQRLRSPADASPIGPPVWSHEEFTAAVEAEREECALVCEAEARRLAAMVAYGNHVAGIAAEKVGNVARAIRSRGGSR
jgi:hypothetical protein